MTLHVVQSAGAESDRKGKITCVTCKLKGCVGRCRWESSPMRHASEVVRS